MHAQPSLPATMRAVAITAPGGPEVLRVETVPLPELREGEVLIRVAAAGVNRHDTGQRSRGKAAPTARSQVPGLEIVGEVVASRSGKVRPGRRVAALVDGGGYADYCAAEADLCLAVPDALSDLEAASLPEALFTSWFGLVELGGLGTGGAVLIHGAAGGVGIAAVQVARLRGAVAVATASRPEKL
ncbi:alcohol dehydrogenase catalytic domain-containing protein, partial [Propylenella binzhouense]